VRAGYHPLRLGGASRGFNQPNNRLFPKPLCVLGVIKPSYEMRLYTMRVSTRDAGRKLLLVTWTLPLMPHNGTFLSRMRNENISDLRSAAILPPAPPSPSPFPSHYYGTIEIKLTPESMNFTTADRDRSLGIKRRIKAANGS